MNIYILYVYFHCDFFLYFFGRAWKYKSFFRPHVGKFYEFYVVAFHFFRRISLSLTSRFFFGKNFSIVAAGKYIYEIKWRGVLCVFCRCRSTTDFLRTYCFIIRIAPVGNSRKPYFVEQVYPEKVIKFHFKHLLIVIPRIYWGFLMMIWLRCASCKIS